jgi:hypothetical protein
MQKTARQKTARLNGQTDAATANLARSGDARLGNVVSKKCFRTPQAARSPFWEIPYIVDWLSSELLKELTGWRRS